MMDKVINNPDDLKKYRGKLMEKSKKLQEQLRETDKAISNVQAGGWDDPKFKEFQNNFSEDKEKIKPLYAIIEEYEGLLHQLEDKLRAYGDIPMRRI